MALKPRKEKGGIEIENAQSLDLKEDASNGSNKISLKAPASLSGDTTYTIPEDGPANAVLQTDASGNLSWTTGVGSGGINYIENYDAATDTTGWNEYDDGANADPVDGTAGSATNLTFSRNTSSPLRGTADFDLAKGAADAQGEGVSYDFDIDSADQAKVLRISFDYTTSADYADDDIRVQIYDKTNSQVIQTVGRDLKAISGKGKHIAEFQTAADSTAYRLCIHVSSTNASAYSVNFDNVEVGPREIARGSVITDWQEYTPTLNNITLGNGKTEFLWRRTGDSIQVKGTFEFGSTTSFSGSVGIGIPDGLTEDANKQPPTENVNEGYAYLEDGTAGNRTGAQIRISSGELFFIAEGAGFVNATSPFTWATGDKITFTTGPIPIQGWSANSEISSDFGGREIAFYAFLDSAQSITDANENTVAFSTTIFDTTRSFDLVNNYYVIPESGYYVFFAHAFTTGNSDDSITVRVRKNGNLLGNAITSTGAGFPYPVMDFFKRGDQVSMTVDSITDSSYSLVSGAPNTFLQGFKIQSPQTLVGSETVAARYTTDSGQSVTNGSVVNFEDKVYDTHNSVTTGGSWNFEAPITGIYEVNVVLRTDNVAFAADDNFGFTARKNASGYAQIIQTTDASGTANLDATGSFKVELSKGDVLDIQFLESVGAVNLAASGLQNFIEITKI